MNDEHGGASGSRNEQRTSLVELPAQFASGDRPLPLNVYDGAGRRILSSGQELPAEGLADPENVLYCLAQDLTELFGEGSDERKQAQPAAPQVSGAAPARATAPPPREGRVVLTSPWVRMLELLARLDTVLHAIATGNGDAAQAEHLARRVQSLCTMDPDAAIAAMVLLKTNEYSVRHSLRVAMLVELMLRRERVGDAARTSAVAAALTMNVGMLEMQNVLYSQREALSEAQRAEIKLHPERGVELLRAAGVTDQLWLDCVAAHHEHADGTGYPRGLREPQVGLEVLTIALVDRYSAMVSERGYRPGAPTDRALNLLLDRLGTTFPPNLAKLLRIEVGAHPPGCVVRLANDEIGVVYRRLRDPGARVVKALLTPTGVRYEDGPRRLTTNIRYAIAEVLTADEEKLGLDPRQIWDAAADPENAAPCVAASSVAARAGPSPVVATPSDAT